jgi:hypothetical protein
VEDIVSDTEVSSRIDQELYGNEVPLGRGVDERGLAPLMKHQRRERREGAQTRSRAAVLDPDWRRTWMASVFPKMQAWIKGVRPLYTSVRPERWSREGEGEGPNRSQIRCNQLRGVS